VSRGEWTERSLLIQEFDERAAILDEVPHLRRYAMALLRDMDAADDLVHDCVHRALSKLHLFQMGTNMRAWLLTIMHHLHIQQARRGRRRLDDRVLDPETEIRHAAPPDQEQGLRVRDLSRALGLLDDRHRQVILMIGLGGLSYKQAAETLDVPIGTVMSRLARGRERLRVLMSDDAAPALRRVK